MSTSRETMEEILENTPVPTEAEVEAPAPTNLRGLAKKIGKEYLEVIDECIAFYQHHGELSLSLPRDRTVYQEKVERHGSLYMIHFLTENFLPYLEAIKDHNRDFFAYQTDKVAKGKGKFEKVKMSYFVGKTTMKRVVQDANADLLFKIFDFFTRAFESLTTTVEVSGREERSFRGDYVQYVSEHFDDHRNFGKMGLVIDNVDVILSDYDPEAMRAPPACEDEEGACGAGGEGKKKKKKKKGKKGSSGGEEFDPFSMFGAGMGDQMGKGLLNSFESTKIGQLAKNISGKMRPEDFPMLADPSKLLASLTNPGAEGGGIGDLIKFVMEEVQTTLKEENIDEKDLIGEAQGMMGGISKMTGMDPEAMMRSMSGAVPSAPGAGAGAGAPPTMPQAPDFSQFAGIFENLGKELQKGLNDAEKLKKDRSE